MAPVSDDTTHTAAATAVQVNLFCREVETVAAFFRALGFAEVFRFAPEGDVEHLEVDIAGTRVGLTSAQAANRIARLGVVAPTESSTELVLWCTDVDALFEAARRAGGSPVAEPQDSPDARIRYGWIRDPEGHQLKFVAPL